MPRDDRSVGVAVRDESWAEPSGRQFAAEALADEITVNGRSRALSFVAVPILVLLALAPAVVGQPAVLGVLAVVVAAGLLLLARSPSRLVLLVVTLVPVTSGLARGLVVPGLRVSEALIVLAAVVVLALPTRLRTGWSALDVAVLGYLIIGTGLPLADLIFVSHLPFDSAALQTLMGPVQFVLLYFVSSRVLTKGAAAVVAQRCLLLASVPISVLAVAESLGPPSVHEMLTKLTGTTAFNTQGYTAVPRAASLFPVWLALAGYLLVIVLLATSLVLVGDREVLPRWALLGVIIAGVLALAASLTVTVMLTLIVGALYLGWRSGKLLGVVLLIGVGTVLASVVFGSLISQRVQAQSVSATVQSSRPSWLPETIGYRVVVWRDQYAGVIGRYAATGYGPGLPPEINWGHTESGYITVMLRGGVLNLAGAAYLLVSVVRRAKHEVQWAGTPARVALCRTALLIAVVQVPINLTFPYFTNSGMPQAAWIVWGLLAARESNDGTVARDTDSGAR